ncbi:hypothetical protein FLL75_10720 [Vibrio cholerae]|nr:hypothetical protein [Vibrio cholerae]TQP75902.1 hypothetical protein FLL75_10720 [Vibrio cholerae]TVM55748.1 hypothetical protein FPV38_07650 [Vibrio cholerae]TVN00454.1 hypothetical protein FPV82_15055 [Vibrio cholerae]TXY14893.1 hypothetical protein FXE97_07190 [Vibrio cholerae]
MPTGIHRAISDKGIAPHHNLVMSEIFVSSIFVTFIELFLFPPSVTHSGVCDDHDDQTCFFSGTWRPVSYGGPCNGRYDQTTYC